MAYNVLVISDLHLGEDLGPWSTEAATLHIDLVEKQLVHFLHYYTRRRENGRPWRLVVNGDIVDFMAICLLPKPENRATREEREWGYRRTPQVSVEKMQMVAERHQEFFRALGRFLARKNRLEIIPGNHDAEFHWPVVQNAFLKAVAESWQKLPDSSRAGAPATSDITGRVGFHPWFFYEKGQYWIEHGHQYDECCSFEHQLYPRQPDSDEMVMNVDTAGTRFVTNYVLEAESHQQEDWSFTGYISFGIGLGLRGCLRLIRGYSKFTTSLLRAYRGVTRERHALEQVRAGHEERLRKLAAAWSLEERALVRVDDLRRRPVVGHLRRLLAVLMLDKLCIYLPAVLIAVFGFLLWGATWGIMTAGGAFLVARVLAWWTSRGRMIDPAMNLEVVSERILKRVDAEYVIFGHTHEPVAKKLDHRGWYFNTGTWVPSGKPGLLSAFTHLVLRYRDGSYEPALCQWRDGASREFTPDWSTHATVTAEPAYKPTPPEPAKVRVAETG